MIKFLWFGVWGTVVDLLLVFLLDAHNIWIANLWKCHLKLQHNRSQLSTECCYFSRTTQSWLLNSSLPLDEHLTEIADLSAQAFAGGVRRSVNLRYPVLTLDRRSMDNADRRRLEPEHRVLQCRSPCCHLRRRSIYPNNWKGRKDGNCKLSCIVSSRLRVVWNASFLPIRLFFLN